MNRDEKIAELAAKLKAGGAPELCAFSEVDIIPIYQSMHVTSFMIYNLVRAGKLEVVRSPGGQQLLTPELLAKAMVDREEERATIKSGKAIQQHTVDPNTFGLMNQD